MPVTKADLRRFVETRTNKKMQEIINARKVVVEETLEPFFIEIFKPLPFEEADKHSLGLSISLDTIRASMLTVGGTIENTIRGLPSQHDYKTLVKNHFINDVIERLRKAETDYYGFEYFKTHKDAYNKTYVTYAYKAKENCETFKRQIKAVKSLEKELLVIIKSASTAKKAYEKLEIFGLDLSTLKPEVVNLPEITKLSQDISLLN